MKQKIISTKNRLETKKLARSLLKEISKGVVICLYGDLGSGKTTFAQGIGEELGVLKSLTSPTFLIIKTYQIDNEKKFSTIKNLYHVDLYRTQAEKEIQETGLVDVFEDQSSIVLIEWAERLGDLLPKRRIDVRFEFVSEKERKITIQKSLYE